MIKRKMMRFCLWFCLAAFFFVGQPCFAAPNTSNENHIFSTGDDFETDKCASIWLIKRFVDSKGVIKFFPKGQAITEGLPFDAPDAKLRRYSNMSTFEAILRDYQLKDLKLIQMGKVIHDIEINTWERKAFPESYQIKKDITQIIVDSKKSDEIVARSNQYFESWYERMK